MFDFLSTAPATTLLADIETTPITYDQCGRLIVPDTIHCITAVDYETDRNWLWGPDPEEIAEAVRWMERSQLVVFHNGRGFDEIVLEHHHQYALPKPQRLDSLVLLRLFWSDVKEAEDFRREAADKHLPKDDPYKFSGELVGRHSLESWGLRLEKRVPKGHYIAECKDAGIEPFMFFCDRLARYAKQDVQVLKGIWKERILPFLTPQVKNAVALEHWAAELSEQMHNTGIKADVPHMQNLAAELTARSKELEIEVQREYPPRFEPVKWVYEPLDANGYTALMRKHPTNKVYRPHFNLPAGYQREQWGEVTFPKVNRTIKDKETGEVIQQVLKYEPRYGDDGKPILPIEKKSKKKRDADAAELLTRMAEAQGVEEVEKIEEEEFAKTKVAHPSNAGDHMGNNAFVKAHWAVFNPNSRIQANRRLMEMGWIPEEFTDAGNPTLDDAQLNKLEEEYPGTKTLATFLMVQKRLGQVATGEKSWINCVAPNGFIYPKHHMCATVTFRGAHADPNISQVPSVRKHKTETYIDAHGKEQQCTLYGEAGKWGYECRACFTVPEGFTQVGVDLSGIEMRMWAHYQWPYDDGKLAHQILNENIHENNRVLLGLADRRKAKEWLFAMIYGSGPEQLGFIINPTASIQEQIDIGHRTKARFMHGVDGFDMLLEQMRVDSRRGWLKGLDGRRVPVRKQHAALNSLLQSAGTGILSKYWLLFSLNRIEKKLGLKWGYDKDFVLMVYSHDETQWAVRHEYAEAVKQEVLDAAPEVGRFLKVRLPIAAEAHLGSNWGQCH